MAKRNRVRRVMKWAGLAGCAVLLVTITMSAWWTVRWTYYDYWGFVQWGGLGIGYPSFSATTFTWDVGRNIAGGGPPLYQWFDYQPGSPTLASIFIIPLWLPLTLLGGLTFFLWRRDRRKPEGCCQECGYDLTRNESGVCPECGTRIGNQQ